MFCDPASIAPEAAGAFALTFPVMTDSSGEWEVAPLQNIADSPWLGAEARQPQGESAPMTALCWDVQAGLLGSQGDTQVSVPTPHILGLLHLESPIVPGVLHPSHLHISVGLFSHPETFLSPLPRQFFLPHGFSDHPQTLIWGL